MNIDVAEKKETISYLGKKLFNYLTTLPRDIRHDKQKRTGIQIFTRVVGTKNQITVSVRRPSQNAKISVIANSVRSECYAQKTSQEHEHNTLTDSVGCISYYLGDENLHMSVMGLKPQENVAIALIILSRITGVSIDEVVEEIRTEGGNLPKELFTQGHYLDDLLNKYRH